MQPDTPESRSVLLVEKVACENSNKQPNDDRERNGSSRGGKRDTSKEDDRLNTLTKNRDEGQHKYDVFLLVSLPAGLACRRRGLGRSLHRLCQLDAPFLLQFADSKERDSHQRDDERREDSERAFVVVLVSLPGVFADAIKHANDDTCNHEAD